MQKEEIVIVGAGPAGMMLAYQMASNGIKIRVIERHPDFAREFRGELIQRSVIEQLEKSGIFDVLLKRGLALPNIERQMFLGLKRRVQVPGPIEVGGIISQPGFLGLLHELCGKYENYRLDFSTSVVDTIRENGRVIALKTKSGQVEDRVDGDFFIICSGRNSALRKSCGLETEVFPSPANALWLKFDLSKNPEAIPTSVDVHMFGKGGVTVLSPSSAKRLHIAYSAPGDLSSLRKNLPELRRALLPTLREGVRRVVDAQLSEATESQMLKIVVDRVNTWHAPGILFLGDAAHTMSPSGGQGLNVAIRDTFVAANLLIPRLQKGEPIDDRVLQQIQDERQLEIGPLQNSQTRVAQMVMKPLPALYIMMTMLGLAMKVMGKKIRAGHGVAPPVPRYLTPLAQSP